MNRIDLREAVERSAGDGDQPLAGYRPGYEVAAERILELIVRLGLEPGSRLPTEQGLADELGFSRSVTREAIKILTALGRVSAQRGRGLFVADGPNARADVGTLGGHQFLPGDPEQVEQLLRFRQILEVAAARAAAQSATPPELRALRSAIEDGRLAHERSDLAAWDEADSRFHRGVAQAARNTFLVAAIDQVRHLQAEVVVLGLHGGTGGDLGDAQQVHRRLFEAIADGAEEAAAEAAADHLETTIVGYRQGISDLLTSGARR